MAVFVKSSNCNCGCLGSPCTSSPPLPTLVCDSISASLSKCGLDEFTSPSTPPKKYLTKSQSGTLVLIPTGGCTNPCEQITNTWSGSLSYDASTCGTTDTRTLTLSTSETGACGSCSGTTSISANADDLVGGGPDREGNTMYDFNNAGICSGSPVNIFGCGGESVTSTEIDLSTSCAGCATGGVKVDLSNEYTTTDLINNVVAALPSYPGTYSGTCSSVRNLTTDEITYSIRRFKYKFILPSLTGYTCYKITWLEGSTAKSYVWDHSATETPVYGPVSEPVANGTISITSIVASCACS